MLWTHTHSHTNMRAHTEEIMRRTQTDQKVVVGEKREEQRGRGPRERLGKAARKARPHDLPYTGSCVMTTSRVTHGL